MSIAGYDIPRTRIVSRHGGPNWLSSTSAMPPARDDPSEALREPAEQRRRLERLRRLPWLAAAAVAVTAGIAAALGWVSLTVAVAAAAAATAVAAVSRHALRRFESWFAAEAERRRRSELAARAAGRAKTEFLANVSHELRTPLNAIVGTTDLLLSGEPSPADRARLEIVESSGEALLALIDDLLDFADAESGRLRLDQVDFDLRRVVAQVEATIAPRAAEKGLDFEVAVDPEVPSRWHGDPARVRQVLFNLLHNAVKFTPRGRVELLAERCRDGVRFSVRDTGIGISAKDRERIFDTFVQADSSSARRFGGTGLGLAITHELVELMGGTLGVDSERGRGSTFEVFLPLAAAGDPAEGERIAGGGRPTAAPEAFRVLVVEDDATNRLLATSHLKALGFRTAAVTGGEPALALLAEEAFDVVLMDCAMPGLDGYETTRRLRRGETENGRGRAVVIAVTAHVQPGERERCLAVGMDDYLAKPYRGRELRAVLERWLPVEGSSFPESSPRPGRPVETAAAAPAVDPQALDRLRRLGERTGDDVFGGMIASFLSGCREQIAAVERAVAAADAGALAEAVHSLVGTSAAIGADGLVSRCRELESLVRSGDLAGSREGVAAVVAEHRRVVAELEAAVR
jgi:signal transduction histidine kinase/CheY-like chemotaxis protein/HPt (histidine-containing phosphotransfer) domain-containing protein